MLRLSALVVELLLGMLGALPCLFCAPVCFLHDGLLEDLPKLTKATRVVCGGGFFERRGMDYSEAANS